MTRLSTQQRLTALEDKLAARRPPAINFKEIFTPTEMSGLADIIRRAQAAQGMEGSSLPLDWTTLPESDRRRAVEICEAASKRRTETRERENAEQRDLTPD